MNLIEKAILEWSYRTKKGYPDLNNKEDLRVFESIFGFTLDEGIKEKNAVRKIIDANPGKFDTMSKDVRIANTAKVSSDEFVDAIKTAFGAEVEVDITPPRTGNNKSGRFNMYTFDDDGNTVSIYLAGGASSNKGVKYELQIAQDLQNYNEGGDEFVHADTVQEIIDTFNLKPGKFKIVEEGGKNQKRPLEFTADGPIIGHSGESVAATLTDLTIIAEGKTYYVSLKYGSTLTFFNAGVAVSTFPASEIQEGRISNPSGVSILKMLGIDNEIFCRVFNEYGQTDFKQYHTSSSDYDQQKLFNLIHSGIGSGYWMLKGTGKGSTLYEITEEYAKKAATPIGGINIQYGGANGEGKRVDISFESSEYYFKLNIRNKQGGLYPSHIMCDYKKK